MGEQKRSSHNCYLNVNIQYYYKLGNVRLSCTLFFSYCCTHGFSLVMMRYFTGVMLNWQISQPSPRVSGSWVRPPPARTRGEGARKQIGRIHQSWRQQPFHGLPLFAGNKTAGPLRFWKCLPHAPHGHWCNQPVTSKVLSNPYGTRGETYNVMSSMNLQYVLGKNSRSFRIIHVMSIQFNMSR